VELRGFGYLRVSRQPKEEEEGKEYDPCPVRLSIFREV